MITEGPRHVEVKGLEALIITPESLLASNRSEKAKELSTKWLENNEHSNITVVVACVDARGIIAPSEEIESVRSIDAGGKKTKEIFEDEAVGLIAVVTHFDGTKFVKGTMPIGCGGAAAFAAMNEAEKQQAKKGQIEETRDFLINHIDHSDPLMQGLGKAYQLARETKKPKPILVGIQDHRTGKIYWFAALNDKGVDKVPAVLNLMYNDAGKYDPAKLYEHGIPILPESDFSDEKIKSFIAVNKANMEAVLRAYPDLSEMQEIQNPRMIFVSSKLPSVRTRYPDLTKYPNSVFKLHLPREKEGGKPVPIRQQDKKEIFSQIQYAITECIKHHDNPNAPFSKTDRVIIETSDINVSRDFAADLCKKPWMETWLKLKDHKIIVIQNKEGITNIAEWYEPQN